MAVPHGSWSAKIAGSLSLGSRTEEYALSPTLDAFVLSFGVILLAELGDKSQLMALAFATRYRAGTVLVAVSIATLLVHAGSVLLGRAFALALPTSAIQVVAGIAFFVFAAWTLRGDSLGAAEEGRANRTGRWALLTIGSAFFLAELGDKTMLATVTLATTEESIGTWLGSTAGMVVADAIAIGIGAILGSRLPERAIKVFAALAFVVFGAILLAEGLHLPGPSGHRSFETVLSGGSRGPSITVVVLDGANVVTSIEPATTTVGGNAIDVVPGANAIRVQWTGGECDERATLTLDRAEISYGIRLHTDLKPGSLNCNQIGIERAVRLDLNQFVPSGSFGLAVDP